MKRFSALLPRSRAGRIALALVIANEVRGVMVVAAVVRIWWHH